MHNSSVPSTHPTRLVESYSFIQLMRDLFGFIKPYRLRFWAASLIRLIGDLAWLYPTIALATIVNFLTNYNSGESLRPLFIPIGLWLLAIVVRNLSQFFTKMIGNKISDQVAIDVTLKGVAHLFKLGMLWHEYENSGNKIKRIQNAAEGFNRIIRIWFNNIIEITVNLILINIIIAHFDRNILFLLGVFLVIYFIVSGSMRKKSGDATFLVNEQEESINGLLFESISNIRTAKVMSMSSYLYSTLVKYTEELYRRLGIRLFWFQMRSSSLSIISNVFKVGAIALIVYGILEGRYEIGFLIMFNSYFSDLRASIDELANASIETHTAKVSIFRFKSVLDEPITIDNDDGKQNIPNNWKTVSIENVSFSYGDHTALNNISLKIRRGEKIGVVGHSGAGKSTLFKLLLKEREDFIGAIRFDDVSLREIKSSDYFRHIAVVLQDTEVFNFSLKENISITKSDQSENSELMQKALATAHLEGLLTKLPQGINTVIGEKGVKLSGGEKQRVSIARALLKRAELLILDEATSALDSKTEWAQPSSLSLVLMMRPTSLNRKSGLT